MADHRAGDTYGTGPDWKIIEYEFKEYRPYSYNTVHEYDNIHYPKHVHEYSGHTYRNHEWTEVRTYEAKDYKAGFYQAPRRKLPPPKMAPLRRSRVRNTDYTWAKLYRCYEGEIGPSYNVREYSICEYQNKDYNPTVTEYKEDKVLYMDREHSSYTRSVDYHLTQNNFYPLIGRVETTNTAVYKDVNNILKEDTRASLKEVTLEEKTIIMPLVNKPVATPKPIEQTKTDDGRVVENNAYDTENEPPLNYMEVAPAAAVVATCTKEESSWNEKEVEKIETPIPREQSPKQTISTSHMTTANDRLTPVNSVVAVGVVAAMNSESVGREVPTPQKGSPTPKTPPSSGQKSISPPVAGIVAGAAIVSSKNTHQKSPSPVLSMKSIRTDSRNSVQHSQASASALVLGGAILATETTPKANQVAENNANNTKALSESPPSDDPKINDPPPAHLPADTVVTNKNKNEVIPTNSEEKASPPESVPKATSQTDTKTVAVAAAVASKSEVPHQNPPATKKQDSPKIEESKISKKENVKASPSSKSNLPPEVIAAIEAYNVAHEDSPTTNESNSVGMMMRSLKLVNVY